MRKLLLSLAAVMLSSGCQYNESKPAKYSGNDIQSLRPMTTDEAMEDLNVLISQFRGFYGPMEYKEQRFNFDFEALAADYRNQMANATSESEQFSVIARFSAEFQDAHVGYRFPLNSTEVDSYRIRIFVTPIEGKALVANVDKKYERHKIGLGDELVDVDGVSPFDLLPSIMKYRAFGNPDTDQHWIFHALNRPFFMTDLLPEKDSAKLVFEKEDGTRYTRFIKWDVDPNGDETFPLASDTLPIDLTSGSALIVAQQSEASLMEMARPKPFFATEKVLKKYGFVKVEANKEHREKYELNENETPDIHAYIYNYEGQNILLVRNYTYSHGDLSNEVYMKGYRAILDQWEEFADVLILDQTHNGGGSYCVDFFKLFIQETKPSFVQACNSDRKWIDDLQILYPRLLKEAGYEQYIDEYKMMASLIERAYDQGAALSEPIALMSGNRMEDPDEKYTWKKPMLVLIDELALSCGDAFPMLIQRGGVAKLFGKKTGGAGGNVESLGPLPNSRATISLTRGLFTDYDPTEEYAEPNWIENNGVSPDFEYSHTAEDFRAGFVDYVKQFSDKALEQIPEEGGSEDGSSEGTENDSDQDDTEASN